jgi:hypothetical protein
MEDVLEIYKRPYNLAVPVICMDEQPTHLSKKLEKKLRLNRGSRSVWIMSMNAMALQ